MDKLTRYNQKLLATIGTILLVGFGIALIASAIGLIISLLDFSNSDNNGLKIQNQVTTVNDTTEFIRTQAVTFNPPFQLDTAQSKFLVAVGQVNLETDEKVRVGSSSFSKSYNYEYSRQAQYGLFNNFIYYDYSSDLSQKIFNERVIITKWEFVKIDSIEVILFQGTSNDDNSDGQIDYNDYQSLFAYYIANNDLKIYDFGQKTVLDFFSMNKTALVSIELGIDKDNDFDFESSSEPQEITTLNLRTKSIQPIVSDQLKNEIQEIIDGIKN
tara:strand:+ start:3237 stop:4049 length:813 start_codon:yes stop_codon:yes gene_type:complete